MCVTDLKIGHIVERFQHANDTISKYFKHVLMIVSSPPFYTKYIFLPPADSPLHPCLASTPKFAAYFQGAVVAINGTHILCCPSAAE
ncbi:hypothetical protein C8Q73DRAFT_621970, partial [Cubamyces lactineus]